MSETLVWWVMVQVVGLAALPLCLVLFRRLPDRGYTLSKPFALLLVGYLFWILNVVHVLPNTTRGIWAVLLLLFVASGYLLWRRLDELLDFVRQHWWLIAATEVVFFLAFITAAYLRSFVPDLGGTEKPMDFMYLNAMSTADRFPPEDPWMAGENVAYYYFGYLLISIMTRLSVLETSIGFNLGLAMIAALAVTGAFGLVYNLAAPREERRAEAGPGTPGGDFSSRPLWRPMVFGFLAALLLAVMGNLEGFLEWMASHNVAPDRFWTWVNIRDAGTVLGPYNSAEWYPDRHIFWWLATRIIEVKEGLFGIHEFPFFSFLLGDLHPHVMSIPFVLLAVGAALALLRSDEPLDLVVWLERPLWLVAFGLILGALAFLNTWDMPTMAIVFTLIVLIRNRLLADRWSWGLAADTVGFMIPLFVVSFLAFIPFFFGGFDSQASGFTADAQYGTRLFHALLIWGPFAVLVLPYAAWRLSRGNQPPTLTAVLWSLAAAVAVVGLWVIWDLLAQILDWLPASVRPNEAGAGLGSRISERGWNWLTVLVVGGSLGLLVLALAREVERAKDAAEESLSHVFALTLSAIAALLILGSDLFFIQDFFNGRMNTIFKLYYQAWLLLSIAGGFVLYEMASGLRLPSLAPRGTTHAGVNWNPGEVGVAVATVGGLIAGFALMNEFLLEVTGAVIGACLLFAAGTATVLLWRTLVERPETGPGPGVLSWRAAWGALGAAVLVAAFVYPFISTWNRTAGCAGHPVRLLEGSADCGQVFAARTLDGLRDFKVSSPDEYAAIEWLSHLDGRPVVAQAVGQGYRWETSRVSGTTGLPTILGWQGHEEQWRGGNEETSPRADDLQALYTSGDPDVVQSIIEKYDVAYVFVGPVERETYPDLRILEMDSVLEPGPAFQQGEISIYRVRPSILSEVTRSSP